MNAANILDTYITRAQQLPAIKTAIVHPVERSSLTSAVHAFQQGLIIPLLIGRAQRIQQQAEKLALDLSDIEIIDTAHSHAAADTAVALAREKRVNAIMKGDLATSELLNPILNKHSGLRTERRLSHVFLLGVDNYHKPLIITDAAINVTPDLQSKTDIVQNAIDFATALGTEVPKVAILAAVEKVKASMPSTIDAAALCKMADRDQIRGAILDGPLAFDNAISRQAASDKHINSAVSGDADILLAPDLEAANMLAKQLIFLGNAQAAGLALGAKVPLILNSRADNLQTRLISCALATILAHHTAETREV